MAGPGGSCSSSAAAPLASRTSSRSWWMPRPTVSHGRRPPTSASVAVPAEAPSASSFFHVQLALAAVPARASTYAATAGSASATGLGCAPPGVAALGSTTSATVVTVRPERGVRTTSKSGGGACPPAAVVAAAAVAVRPLTTPRTASATWRSASASMAVASSCSALICAARTPRSVSSVGRLTAASSTAAPSQTRRIRMNPSTKNGREGKASRRRSITSGRFTIASTFCPSDSVGCAPSRVASASCSAPRTVSEASVICQRSASASWRARSRSTAAVAACSVEGPSTKR